MKELPPDTPSLNRRVPIGRRSLAGLAPLVFLAFLFAYYVGHKPISLSGAGSLLATTVDLALAIFVVGLGGGIGRRLAGNIRANPGVALVVQAALGLGALAMMVLGLLWAGLFSRAAAWALGILLVLAFGKSSIRWLAAWASLDLFRPVTWTERLSAVAVAILLALALVEAAAPPVHFDALVYHLELPRRFLAARSLFVPLDNAYWGMPLNGEMLYTLAAALGRTQTATVLGFAAAALTCAGVFALASEFGKSAGWVSIIALVAGKSLAASAGWGYVDWWAGLFGFALIALVFRFDETSNAGEAALAGVMAGLAAGVKYSAAIALPAGLLAILMAVPSRRGLRLATVFLGVGVLALSPWLLKNLVGTGAPLYPYFGDGRGMPPVRQLGAIGSVSPPPLAQSLFAPVAATLLGHEQAPGFDSDIGPLLIALLPGLVLLPEPSRRRLLPIGTYLLAGWGLWAAASRISGMLIQTRLYYVLLPAWAILAGCGFLGLARVLLGPVRVGRAVAVLMALVVVLALYDAVGAGVEGNGLRPILGSEFTDEYLTRRLGGFYAAQKRLEHLPPGSRTLMLWEPRGFYCPAACVSDAWIDEWYAARRTLASPKEIQASWVSRGFTHVLLFNAGKDYVEVSDARYQDEDWQALEDLLGTLTPIEQIGDGYTLFRLH